MKRILLTTDFSDNAMNAAQYAIDLWGLKGVSYTLMNCYLEPSSANVVASLTDFMREESQKGLDRHMEELQEKYGDKLHIESLSHYGDLVSVMKMLHQRAPYDYGVVASRGASRLETLFMGSNTINAVKSVEMPLLVVPVGKKFEPLKQVVLAADYEHMNEMGHLRPLTDLVREQKGELMIVHVELKEQTDYEHALEGFSLHSSMEGIEHSFHTEMSESVVEGIRNFIWKNETDLIAIVKRHRSFLDRLFHQSITKELAVVADKPMLVIHD